MIKKITNHYNFSTRPIIIIAMIGTGDSIFELFFKNPNRVLSMDEFKL